MRIKDIFFSTARILSLILLFVAAQLVSSDLRAQITSGTVNPDETTEEEKKPKKEKSTDENLDSLTGTNFYFSGLFQYGYRTFEDNSPTGTFYSEWQNQTHAYSGGASMGILMELSDFVHLDIGVSYFGHGENYTYQDSLTDSSYTYKNNYMQFAIPMRIRFVYGNKLQVFAFAGLAPLNILKIKYESSYKTAEGANVERDPEIKTDGFATFNLMLSAGLGITYNLNRVAFFLAPEYRRHLINTYSTKTIGMTHKMYGIGINAGLVLKF